MSFVQALSEMDFQALLSVSQSQESGWVSRVLAHGPQGMADFARLISPGGAAHLEPLAKKSQALTQQRFGKVIRLFAPLYLSNECVNICKYCGFSRDNPILRVTLSIPEVEAEADALLAQGFRHILLVAGEHPKWVSPQYLEDCVKALAPRVPGLSLEVGPLDTADYTRLAQAGAEGLVVYQETYDRNLYSQLHTAGPKKDFDYRLETPERAYQAGFRRLGIGALFGLADWRMEALHLAHHATYLLKHCWKAQLTLSLPRLRPCAGEFAPLTTFSDQDMVQLICALRLFLPDVGIVLSTREPATLRNGLLALGVTMMSAGSHTEPGGYTGAGKENVHRTEKGRIVAAEGASEWASGETSATGQFEIADERSPQEVAQLIRSRGYEPVWKDWDPAWAETNPR